MKVPNYTTKAINDSGLLKSKLEQYTETLSVLSDVIIKQGDYASTSRINPYWVEYHFFYMRLSTAIKKAFKMVTNLQIDLVGFYECQKDKPVGRVLLEIKTRRKPLTGQYLMYRQGGIWFNLELQESHDHSLIYQFTKDENLYRLVVEKDKSSAHIELVETNSADLHISVVKNIKIKQMWDEIIDNYTENFAKISKAIKQDNSPYPNCLLSNGIMWDIYDYFSSENNHSRAISIAKLNNTYLDVWRGIPGGEKDED